MRNNWLNLLILFYVCQEKNMEIDIQKAVNKLLPGNTQEKTDLCLL